MAKTVRNQQIHQIHELQFDTLILLTASDTLFSRRLSSLLARLLLPPYDLPPTPFWSDFAIRTFTTVTSTLSPASHTFWNAADSLITPHRIPTRHLQFGSAAPVQACKIYPMRALVRDHRYCWNCVKARPTVRIVTCFGVLRGVNPSACTGVLFRRRRHKNKAVHRYKHEFL